MTIRHALPLVSLLTTLVVGAVSCPGSGPKGGGTDCAKVETWCDGTCPTYDTATGHEFECDDQYDVQIQSEAPIYYGDALYFDVSTGALVSVHEWTDDNTPDCDWYGPEITCTKWCATVDYPDTGWEGDTPMCE